MLSISLIKSSAAAVSYYEKDDYYAANGGDPDAQGQWWGAGAERLGLSGTVCRETFKNILDGHLPNGVVLGTQRDGELQHRPGWDLTFSAPKSVSIMAEVGGDQRLIEAHGEAVREALSYLQDNAAAYRQRGMLNLREREADNLVVALFQHDTSRNQDPQLHTHAVVANVAQRSDGQWVSLFGDPLFTHKMAAGNVYRAALAAKAQQLGYQVERTHLDGRFELTAVPEPVAEAFASRRTEIEKALERRGLSGPEASARVALLTRKSKEVVDRAELQPGWLQHSQVLGFDPRPVGDRARQAGDQTPTQPFDLDRAIGEAVVRLSESEAVFSRAELVRWSLAGSMGRARIREVEKAIAHRAKTGELVAVREGGRTAWTTPAAHQREKRFLASLAEGGGRVEPAMSRRDADAVLANSPLNDGQRHAAAMIVSAEDRYVGVLGRPGVGKTFMLGHVRILMESRGFTLKGMAANSEAARQIAKDSGIASSTIQKHLQSVAGDLATLKGAKPAAAAQIRAGYAKQAWVVDEASQLDARTMRRLSYAADRLGARVVMIGDTKQLAAIGAGKPFDLMLKHGMKHVEMDEIRRQDNPEHVAAIRATIAGDIPAAMAKLKAETREIADKDVRLQAMLDRWGAAGAERDRMFMLTSKNTDKTLLNDGARQILRNEGRLRGETSQQQLFRVFSQRADRIESELYKPGDVVRFGRAVGMLGIGRGEYVTVVSTDRKLNTVLLEKQTENGPQRVIWNPRAVAGAALQGVELYRPRDTTVAAGERIQWNRNSSDHQLANGQTLTVVAVDKGAMTVQTETGERKQIDTRTESGRHWEHAYATTIYKSQGGTAQTVLVNAEASQRELFNQKAFLVAISRQKENLVLFTDNIQAFTDNVARELGDKTSAIEANDERRWHKATQHLEAMLQRLRGSSIDGHGADPERDRSPGVAMDR